MKNFIFALLLFSIGCSPIVTLHPLSENKSDFIFKKELMGEWKETKEGSSSIFVDTVTSEEGPVYHIFMKDNIDLNFGPKSFKNKFWFFARIIKLDRDTYLDIWFDVNHLNIDTINQTTLNHETINSDPILYPGHQIIQIQILDPTHITYSMMDGDKLYNLIKSKKVNLNFAKVKSASNILGESYLIYNESKQLQAFFRQANNFGLFDAKKELMHKVSEEGIYSVYESEPYIKPYKKQ